MIRCAKRKENVKRDCKNTQVVLTSKWGDPFETKEEQELLIDLSTHHMAAQFQTSNGKLENTDEFLQWEKLMSLKYKEVKK